MTQPTPINESAAKVVSDFVKACQSDSEDQTTSTRNFQFEKLEERCVLSGNGFDLPVEAGLPDDLALVATEDIQVSNVEVAEEVQTEVTSVTLRINGEEQVVNLNDPQLELAAGDVLEVVEIGLDSNATEGVFAVEGYINKLEDDSSASLIDYQDGRFSLIEDNFAANGGSGVVQGLDGSWEVGNGYDRLTLTVLHYTESGADVATRSLIQLEVGSADFAFDESAFQALQEGSFQVGENLEIFGRWFNNGNGKFHNYAEVDIYHESNREQIIWAGAITGNPTSDNLIEGFFTNTRADDPFTEVFVPELEGNYIFRFYLDPEGIVAESNESNNQIDVIVNVEGAADTTSDSSGFDRFVVNEDLKLRFINEQQFSFGFGVQNDSNQPVENWAVQILGADYKLDASQLSNSSAFELIVNENADGTYDYLFVGNSPIAAFNGLNTDWSAVNFGRDISSASVTVGQVKVDADSSNGGDTSTETEYVGFEEFRQSDKLNVSFANEKQFSFGFGVQNNSNQPVENWAVEILGADYKLDASQLTNSDNFDLTVTENADGTYNYLFVGTSPISAFGQLPGGNIEWQGVNFGQDISSFSFTAGQVVVTDTANVTVESSTDGFKVNPVASGDQSEEISLQVKADANEFSHVRVSNVPDGAKLSAGEQTTRGSFDVPVSELGQLSVALPQDFSSDFELALTPVSGDVAYYDLTEAVKVDVVESTTGPETDPNVDFGLVTGYEAKMPYSLQLENLGQSEGQTVVFSGLPEFVYLSAGERADNGNWLLQADDVEDLRIGASRVDDLSGFTAYGDYGFYEAYTVDVALQSNTSETLSKDQFDFYAIQKA